MMKSVCFSFIYVMLLFHHILAQNLDILTKHSSGKYVAMGGAGLGITEGISAVDLNPAGLKNFQSISLAVSAKLDGYFYDSFIQNEGTGTIESLWRSLSLNLKSIVIVFPLNKKISMGSRLFQKIHPFLKNEKRVSTWSTVFTQKTSGNLYALTLACGYEITENISLGLTFYKYLGITESRVIGDAHGTNLDKWAYLKNDYSGFGFRIGSQVELGNLSAGIIFEMPTELDVKTTSSISRDSLYRYLLPHYDETVFKLPLIFGIGLTYEQKKSFILSIDIESQKYSDNNIQFNLFEYGGKPEWINLFIFHAGIEFYPLNSTVLPIRLGYAYTPQLYFSNNSVGTGEIISNYSNTDQNIIHTFSAGTSFIYGSFEFNIGIEYSFYKWNRKLETYITINEYYSEKTLSLVTQITFQF